MSDRQWTNRLGQSNLQFGLLTLLVIASSLLRAQQVAAIQVSDQPYVTPVVWPGVLILQSELISSNTPLAEPDLKLLKATLSNKDSRVVLALEPSTSEAVELSGVLNGRESLSIRVDAEHFCGKLHDAETVKAWADCDAIWIDVTPVTARAIEQLDAVIYERLEKCLAEVLASGGFVRITGDLSWLGFNSTTARKMLLEHCTICAAPVGTGTADALVQVCLPGGVRCALAKRQLVNLSTTTAINIRLAATEHYPAPLEKTLKEGESIDWVQWQRARLERLLPQYPGQTRVGHALARGSLVIGGGGGMPEEVWKRFVELAGGKKSRIVILPTAVEEPKAEQAFEERVLKLAGAAEVVTLPQHQRREVEAAQFLAELDQATGVWFGGGRHWRFVDAYWGTPAWEKLIDVCKRGGVIGGSSAGATIQGDLLVRGAPAGNHIMIADGYRRGLGLLPGVAIDQHFAQRNRFRELEGCLAESPSICGIGIDEQTALVVTSPHQCEVIGTGSVWYYPSYEVTEDLKADNQTRAAMRLEYKSGSQFSLAPK
jgi:cyanophycinase